MKNLLAGKKVAVLVETEFIPDEVKYYEEFFSKYGAEVEFLTYLWGEKERVIVSDVDAPGKPVKEMTVNKDISDANPDDYSIILTAANYVAVRLREIMPMGSLGSADKVQTPPAVQFMEKAMNNHKVVKGALCHALWILTPLPHLLKGRKVICHTVVLADVINAGAVFVPEESHVVVDGDLVTGRSAEDIKLYCDKILEAYNNLQNTEYEVESSELSTQKLIDEAIKPERWIQHLKEDLMKFWDKPAAYNMKDGVFPTYRTNSGDEIDPDNLPEEIKEALASPDTKGLIDLNHNFIRSHSRQTYAYGIAFHMTGNPSYLKHCRDGAMALIDAIDGNYGMFVKKDINSSEWDLDRKNRTSQDLAYGLTGLGMYYFLTHDISVMHHIIQIKDYIFKTYMDDGKGYLTWFPKHEKDADVQIVAQLDQLYAYMLMITPSLPEPYCSSWKKDMKKIVDILITQFYSQHYDFFWGVEKETGNMTLGTDHTDFGHSVKTLWVIMKVGELLGEPFYIDFARPKIDKILKAAYIERNGTWARRYNADGSLDEDKEWWILAELDQACEILSIHDPWYYKYLNKTQKYWLETMVDHENGEIWHMVDKDGNVVKRYPKVHNWKNALHSFEHALFSYMTAARIKDEPFELYYALPEWERVSHNTVAPYMFFGNVVYVSNYCGSVSFLPDGNNIFKVTYNGLH